jgi:hypothetical protein
VTLRLPDRVTGRGSLPSAYAVTDLAVAALAHAAGAVADLIALDHPRPSVTVDRPLASAWFRASIRPIGWSLPPIWDAVAGDYPAADGWIRLHTNAPHHRAAALGVLGVPAERDAVAAAVHAWEAEALEDAVVGAGGCAAALRSPAAWASHPQGAAVAAEPLVAEAPGTDAPPLPPATPARPLAGVRVLDLTRVLAGPVATRFLAGFGADVLRIDPPDWDEPPVVPEVTVGKRCARLDARTPAGRRTLERLLGAADVLVHGYRPGALDALGLDAARRAELRPGLVEVTLDAYGWTGPWAGRRGFDSLVQMSTGIAAASGGERGAAARGGGGDKPVPLPVQALDHATGYLLAAAAVDGLARRRAQGRGTTTRCSLARTAAWLTSLPPTEDPGAHDDDATVVAEGVEDTTWGPARRLRPPIEVAGTHAPAWEG